MILMAYYQIKFVSDLFTNLVLRSIPEDLGQHHGHYSDVMMSAMASQITGVSIFYSIVCSGTDQRKYQSSASPACDRCIPRKKGQ